MRWKLVWIFGPFEKTKAIGTWREMADLEEQSGSERLVIRRAAPGEKTWNETMEELDNNSPRG